MFSAESILDVLVRYQDFTNPDSQVWRGAGQTWPRNSSSRTQSRPQESRGRQLTKRNLWRPVSRGGKMAG